MQKNNKTHHLYSQSGSVIFYVLLGVVLFAALNFAVSQINRGGSNDVDSELSEVYASEIMQYSSSIQRSLQRMKIEGVQPSSLCFDHATWGDADYDHGGCSIPINEVFNFDGGGVVFQAPSEKWYVTGSGIDEAGKWIFSAKYEVDKVGTTSSSNNTVASSADLLILTAPIKESICKKINEMIENDKSIPSLGGNYYASIAAAKFTGTFADTSGTLPNNGRERCVKDGNGHFMYYKVLLSR